MSASGGAGLDTLATPALRSSAPNLATEHGRSMHRVPLLLIALSALVACDAKVPAGEAAQPTAQAAESRQTPAEPEQMPAVSSTGEAFTLPPAELEDAMRRARAGDAAAAMRVAEHFELGQQQQQWAHEWLELAATHGDVNGMITLASYLGDESGVEPCERAREWLARAEQSPAATPEQAARIEEERATLGDCAQRAADAR